MSYKDEDALGSQTQPAMDALRMFAKSEALGERTSGNEGANVPPPSANTANTDGDNTVAIPLPVATREPGDSRPRVMLCGTYPIGQSNGYSRVVYYIAKHLGFKTDIQLTIYGFQNYKQTAGSDQRNDIPAGVILHDALATENPKRHGFGEKEIGAFLKANPQDVVIIFNDLVITSALTQTIVAELSPEERRRFKLVSYMDQVYPFQKKQYIDILNTHFDAVVMFTPYWEGVAKRLGLRKDMPTFYFPHGFDASLYFPIPRKIARMYYNVPEDAFVVLQLNRNQPRKRLDHTMMAWALVIAKHQELLKKNAVRPEKDRKAVRPIKLMIGTMIDGFWNLMEVLEHELGLLGIPMEVGKEYITSLAKPQQMSDRDINVLYSACDIGLNTCEGEGFGLCQFEHMAVGCPQVAPNIGGFREFMNNGNSTPVDARWFYHIDKQRDGIGGRAEVADPKDYADAIWKYYTNPALVEKHGKKARREILQHYRWETVVDHFYFNILKTHLLPR